jgi:hypothetical protein
MRKSYTSFAWLNLFRKLFSKVMFMVTDDLNMDVMIIENKNSIVILVNYNMLRIISSG